MFVSGNPHLPEVVGGIEINTHELATELGQRGHCVAVLSKLSPRSPSGLWGVTETALGFDRIRVHRGLGYPVFRARRPWDILAQLPRPSVAVVQNARMLDFAAGFAELGVPSVAYLHGLEFESWKPSRHPTADTLPFCGYIANSEYTAGRFKRVHGRGSVVVPPLFRRNRYATQPQGGDVTFINPVPVKGLDLALAIAELCPEIPFAFVLGWPLGARERHRLKTRIRPLANVRLRKRAGDMRAVYRATRILLVPSQWEAETWGRVVSEAQFSGIPVVASNRGGLPEAVGPGGVIIEHNAPAEVWASTIRNLWRSEVCYKETSCAALRHSQRPLLDPEIQLRSFVSALRDFSGSQ